MCKQYNQSVIRHQAVPAIRISVVIPVYNGAAFIQHCLDSVYKQTHSAEEIIVIDDGSSDGTPDILRLNQPAIRVITQPNAGRSAARNVGIKQAMGDYVAFLDADDQFLPDHLKQLVDAAYLSDAEIVYDVIGPPFFLPHERLPQQPYPGKSHKHLACCRIWTVNAMVRREWIDRHDIRFNEALSISEDAEFFWKMILLGARFGYSRKIGTSIGIHDANSTSDPSKTLLAALSAYDSIDLFIRDRALHMTSNLRRQIDMGRRHKQIMSELFNIRAAGAVAARHYIRPLIHMLLARQPTRPVERLRCLLALFGIGIPCLMHNHRFERLVFGFSVSRSRASTQSAREVEP